MTTLTEPRSARINARLDEAHADKLDYLKRTTGLPVSDIVKRGIDLVYEETRRVSPSPREVLAAAGFVGVAEGPADLSTRYKEDLASSLAAKHGDR